MPVTAKLSKLFYERLGDEVTNELVDWFNAVDATYRGDLRELNELNFARFDAKVGQRFAESEARMDRRFVALEAKYERRFITLESKLDTKLDGDVAHHAFAQLDAHIERLDAKLDAKIDRRAAELQLALEKTLRRQTWRFFSAWSVLLIAIIGLWIRR
jgi:hypothetical protein